MIGIRVVESSGADEGEFGSILTVVFLGLGVLDEGTKFSFEVFESGGSIKGFIVAEEGDDDVGLELGGPLIGGGQGAGAGVDGAQAVFGFREGWVELFSTGEGPGV